MREAARISETSVDNYFTRQYIPEDNSELHTRRRENMKYHNVSCIPMIEDLHKTGDPWQDRKVPDARSLKYDQNNISSEYEAY
jgi:hypothetical protein